MILLRRGLLGSISVFALIHYLYKVHIFMESKMMGQVSGLRGYKTGNHVNPVPQWRWRMLKLGERLLDVSSISIPLPIIVETRITKPSIDAQYRRKATKQSI